jgi:hypothetical protein
VVLLGVTLAAPVRADDSQAVPMGNGLRVGSVVGFTEIGGEEALALGGQIAAGHRFGRFTLEAELDGLELSEHVDYRNYESRRGSLYRVGVTARVDVTRFEVGPRSLLVLFVETGTGRQRSRWDGGETGTRTDTHVGMGWVLDHRSRRQHLLPAVGWHVGWRLIGARTADAAHMSRSLCRGKDCTTPDDAPTYDTGLLVTSGLIVSW